MLYLFSALLCSSIGLAEQNPPGVVLENAIIADIPAHGLVSLEQIVPGVIPSPIEVPEFSDESSACWTGGYWYKIQFKRGNAHIDVSNIDLTSQNGYLDLAIDLEVYLNDTVDPFRLNYWLGCIKYKCDGYVEQFNASVNGMLYIDLVDPDGDGLKEADVSFAEDLQIEYDLNGDYIQLYSAPNGSCPLDGLESIFQFFGGSLYDIVLNSIGLEDILADALPELETTIEDAINQANIDEDVDLGGVTFNIQLRPNELQIQEEGIRLAFNAASSAEPNECILPYDPQGSKKTDNDVDLLSDFPMDYDFGAIATDDFVNQTLYALWSSGVLCQTIDDSVFALDTSILNLLSGEAFKEFFPESQAMVLKLDPKNPPTLNMDTDADLAVDLEELGLDFYADVDFRMSRALAVNMNTDVGVGLGINPSTGALELDIDLDPARVVAEVGYNEFVPDSNATIEESFTAQLDTILGFIDIEGLLGDLDLSIPALVSGEESSIGLQDLTVLPSGSASEDVGIYSTVGPVDYIGGCASEEGEEGCGGGCASTGRAAGRQLLLCFVLTLGLLRRRFV